VVVCDRKLVKARYKVIYLSLSPRSVVLPTGITYVRQSERPERLTSALPGAFAYSRLQSRLPLGCNFLDLLATRVFGLVPEYG